MNKNDFLWLYPMRWYVAAFAFVIGLCIFIPMAIMIYYQMDALKTDDLTTKKKYEELQAFLIQNPDRVNKRNHIGFAPLHSAILKNDVQACNIILECGGDANQRLDGSSDDPQWTPLHCAASSGSIDIGKLLIQHGADTTSVSAQGNTPIDIARERSQQFQPKQYLQFIAWAEQGYPIDEE